MLKPTQSVLTRSGLNICQDQSPLNTSDNANMPNRLLCGKVSMASALYDRKRPVAAPVSDLLHRPQHGTELAG